MSYPNFFNKIETIKLKDPLSKLLGASEDGIFEYSYQDIVKMAGHSCPTITGAYLMCQVGLKELYKDKIPTRGEILVSFKEDNLDGVAGVIASVVSNITGATENHGFKGMAGKLYVRTGLIEFNANISSSIKFTRKDTGKSVEVIYDPSDIPAGEMLMPLFQLVLQGLASEDEKNDFGKIWQKRVEDIFDNIDKVITVKEWFYYQINNILFSWYDIDQYVNYKNGQKIICTFCKLFFFTNCKLSLFSNNFILII